jgi:hypothetical protein
MHPKLKIDDSLTDDVVLWLARADTFKDRHEGRFPDEMRELLREAYKTLPDGPGGEVKDAENFQEYLLKNTFISC